MQLLRITRVPMKYEFVTEAARLEYKNDPGGFTIDRQGGELNIQTSRTTMQKDSTEFFNDLGLRTTSAAKKYAVAEAKQDYSEAVARYVDYGNQMQKAYQGVSIPDIMQQRMMQDVQGGNLTMVPLSPVNISWNPGTTQMSYRPTQLNFDWQMAKSSMEFIPGKFSVNIQQYPELKIEYLGRPHYVPPSADPEHTGD